MNILDYNKEDFDLKNESILKSIHNKKYDVVIQRNFFSKEECAKIVDLYKDLSKDSFTVYDGYCAIPRPFDKISSSDKDQYLKETSVYQNSMREGGIESLFHDRLSSLSPDYKFSFNDESELISKSRTWSSIRELESNKGYFEIHCGRLFQELNDEFFSFFSKKADINNQLAFLIVLQRPISTCDLEVFDLEWNDVNTKVNKHLLLDKNGKDLPVSEIPSEKIILNEGDILIFDEGNYWHLVPPFEGDKSRISFGGFMTKLYNSNEVLVWF